MCSPWLHAQVKKVALKVDVLGRMHPSLKYYHPIQGEYTIYPKKIELSKKQEKELINYVFIQPVDELDETVNQIQSNSLRYYVNPDELIYINWNSENDSINKSRLDSIEIASNQIREDNYATLVKNYFNPFFLSKYEVTNREYKEFMNWIKDSIIVETLFYSNELSNEEASYLLKIPKSIRQNGITDEINPTSKAISEFPREIIRELYPLDIQFDYWENFEDEKVARAISPLFEGHGRRWYKKREFSQNHLSYKYQTISLSGVYKDYFEDKDPNKVNILDQFLIEHELNIYPDTSCWLKAPKLYNSWLMFHVYFWHPAYDNYPVIGISYEQAKAYCHWKQKQLEKALPEIANYFYYDLPNLQEYEWAITFGQNKSLISNILDNELITNLSLGVHDSSERDHSIERVLQFESGNLQSVFAPKSASSEKIKRKMRKGKIRSRFTIEELVSIQNQQDILPNGLTFLSNNVSEWMNESYTSNYEKLIEAYINYKCLCSAEYCDYKREMDLNRILQNDKHGNLIIGANFLDQRFGSIWRVNRGGIYPKTFRDKDKSFPTVGFRCVLRFKPWRRAN
jgi:formylglycine-generating enzyme required for sulfatase activity